MLLEPQRVNQERLKEKMEDLKIFNEKIFKLEERMMKNETENSTYKAWFQKFTEEKANFKYAIVDKNKF